MSGTPTPIVPYKVLRECEPSIDPQRLTLSDEVREKNTVFANTAIEIQDFLIPSYRQANIEDESPDYEFIWNFGVVLQTREEWTPTAFGIGELIETISLLPNEEMTLEVKTWETSKTQQDESTEVSDSNSSDVKQMRSSANQVATENARKTHEYFDASAGYSGFGGSVSVKGGWSQDVSRLQKNMSKAQSDSEERAASELRTTRKTRLAVSRESGSESKSVRRLRNINQAQTLNVNFFSLLRRYDVVFARTGAFFVVLGPEVNLRSSGGVWMEPFDPTPGHYLNFGELIRYASDSTALQLLTEQTGRSPIADIRNAWSAQLLGLALALSITNHSDQDAFLRKLHEYLRPIDTWMLVDGQARYRWGYEVVQGLEADFLRFLVHSSPVKLVAEPDEAIQNVTETLEALEAPERIDAWTVDLPSPGMHADLSLGICSGAEDYFEAQRHFDLELKRLEVEKLSLEVERLQAINAAVENGVATVKVTADSPSTAVNIGVTAQDPGINIAVENSGENEE